LWQELTGGAAQAPALGKQDTENPSHFLSPPFFLGLSYRPSTWGIVATTLIHFFFQKLPPPFGKKQKPT